MTRFKVIAMPTIMLMGTSFSSVHAAYCVTEAYAGSRVTQFSLGQWPFELHMSDRRFNSDHKVRHPLRLEFIPKVGVVQKESLEAELKSTDIIHLNVPLLPKIWEYVNLIVEYAKQGVTVILPNAQDPFVVMFFRKMRPDIHLVCFEIFPALGGVGHPNELRAEKCLHRIFAPSAEIFTKVLPYLFDLYSGVFFPILQDLRPALVNGANASYHPLIHYSHVAQALKVNIYELSLFLTQSLDIVPLKKNPLFYLDCPVGDELYQMGQELVCVQSFLQRLNVYCPSKVSQICSEYDSLNRILLENPQLLPMIHPHALDSLKNPDHYMSELVCPSMMFSGPFMAGHYGHITGMPFPTLQGMTKETIFHAQDLWLSPNIYQYTRLPLNPNGTIKLSHRFIEEDMRILIRNTIFAVQLGLSDVERQLPLHMAMIRCYQVQKSVEFFKNGHFTKDAYQLVFNTDIPPSIRDIAELVFVDHVAVLESKL